jgi:predicted lactoylglutathione lyase
LPKRFKQNKNNININKMEVTGKIKVISAEQQISPTFRKKELVVTTDEQYPQSIMIEFTQDKADLLNSFSVGEVVKVSINLGGREWVNPQGETKYFNSIKGWRIERVGDSVAPSTQPVPMPVAEAFPAATSLNEEEPDDLPF